MEEVLDDHYLNLTEYGDLVLPEFSVEEKALRNLDISFEAFDVLNPVSDRQLKLKGLKPSAALREIDDMVCAFVISQMVVFSIDEDLLEDASKGLAFRKFNRVDRSSPKMFVLRELNARANRLKFLLMEEWLENVSVHDEMPQVAVYEYYNLTLAMAATDRLAIKLIADKPPIDATRRRELGFTNSCAVIRGTAEAPYEMPLHIAYPEETDVIVAAYRDLLSGLYDCLVHTPEGSLDDVLLKVKIPYYESVLKAYETSDPQMWKQADLLFTSQVIDNCVDILHVHPMMTGYLGDPTIRFPEISLRMPDVEASRAQEITERTKQTMISNFSDPRFFGSCPAVLETADVLSRTNATHRHFFGSGLELDIIPKGRANPSDFFVRQQCGSDVSLDLETERRNWNSSKKHFKAVFGTETFDRMFREEKDFDKYMGRVIAAQEYGHALGLRNDTYERIGDSETFVNPFIEKWKAMAAGLVANEWIPYLKREENMDRLKEVLAEIVFDACRFATGRHTYRGGGRFRASIMFMKVAEDVGVLRYNEKGGEFPWEINMDSDVVERFFQTVFAQFEMVANIYGGGDENDLRAYLSQVLKPTAFTRFLCERLPGSDSVSVDQMTDLPPRVEKRECLKPVLDEARMTALQVVDKL